MTQAQPQGTHPKRSTPSFTTQLIASLLVAVFITLATIALVTAKIGPGLDSEELHDLRGGGGGNGQVDDHSGPG